MYGKHDWSETVALAQQHIGSMSQDDVDSATKELAFPSQSEHDGALRIAKWAAENGIISADVETELNFCLGPKYDESNGGWGELIDVSQKYAAITVLFRLGQMMAEEIIPSVMIIVI